MVLCTTSFIRKVADTIPEGTQVVAFMDEAAACQDAQVARVGAIRNLSAVFWLGDRL